MSPKLKITAALALGIVVGYLMHPVDDLNAKPTYGSYGLPKNCRALIQANLEGYESGQFTAKEALASIDRNCGSDGQIWGK